MPPNPSNRAHGFAMRCMSNRDMQIPKSEKNNSWPPLLNPGYAPEKYYCYTIYVRTFITIMLSASLCLAVVLSNKLYHRSYMSYLSTLMYDFVKM